MNIKKLTKKKSLLCYKNSPFYSPIFLWRGAHLEPGHLRLFLRLHVGPMSVLIGKDHLTHIPHHTALEPMGFHQYIGIWIEGQFFWIISHLACGLWIKGLRASNWIEIWYFGTTPHGSFQSSYYMNCFYLNKLVFREFIWVIKECIFSHLFHPPYWIPL